MSTPLTTETPERDAPLLPTDSSATVVPPLEPGDRLTRDEFERRYDAMPHLKKAELIEGVVHMPSPVRWKKHGSPHFQLITWLGHYEANTPGIEGGDNASTRLDLENEPQPDAALIIEPAFGGNVRISSDDYVVGAPELVAEVTASSVSIDLNTKFRVYRRNEVQEYVVWRVHDQAIDWFVLRHGDYERLSLNPGGQFQSGVFPGLWLDAAAMVGGDLAQVLRSLDDGIRSPAHVAFVEHLRQASQRTTS
jgi:Uma2 family endonuclease